MLQADVTAARWQQDSDGAWLCLRVQSPRAAMAVCDELQPDKQYVAQIKRKGRSLDANAYAWVLLDKLAAHYGIPRNDVYREEIKTIGGSSRCSVHCIKGGGRVLPKMGIQGNGLDGRARAEQNSRLRECDRLVRLQHLRCGADEPPYRPNCCRLQGSRHRDADPARAGFPEISLGRSPAAGR